MCKWSTFVRNAFSRDGSRLFSPFTSAISKRACNSRAKFFSSSSDSDLKYVLKEIRECQNFSLAEEISPLWRSLVKEAEDECYIPENSGHQKDIFRILGKNAYASSINIDLITSQMPVFGIQS